MFSSELELQKCFHKQLLEQATNNEKLLMNLMPVWKC